MLEWPQLVEPGSQSLLEILLLSLPSMLLFVLLGHWLKARPAQYASFLALGALAAFFAAARFAEAYGSTWTLGEIVRTLLLAHGHLLALALLPGALLIAAVHRLADQTAQARNKSPLP